MGHSGLKTERKFTVQVYIQHHGAVQPHTAIPRLTRAPLRSHTARTDRHWACKKQPAKAEHSSLADFDTKVVKN